MQKFEMEFGMMVGFLFRRPWSSLYVVLCVLSRAADYQLAKHCHRTSTELQSAILIQAEHFYCMGLNKSYVKPISTEHFLMLNE